MRHGEYRPCKCDYRLRYCDLRPLDVVEKLWKLANVITACGIVTTVKPLVFWGSLNLANVITACGIVTSDAELLHTTYVLLANVITACGIVTPCRVFSD